ncbi:precorrin-6A synthase (deacetylating) [Roseiarcus fermentans]|uniref:Precorrin-6A synthase [deacetylating] n=1 Tax=Roseiarcus fermentans TaxID=1473586 RepID=A0A366ELU5_9HYPH|nr:precorrin-6A synthase (deacetylating) [Roseiarcus fermentans]RBP02449.1 precorrin-6A synthase (deacetylating) [Roseiarcus fermentans]
MRTLYLIGMGPGGPEYLTTQAIEALRKVDVFFILEKQGRGKDALAEARLRILDAWRGPGNYRVVKAPSPPRDRATEDYLDVVADWHARKAEILADLIAEHLSEGEAGGVLVWGDPALYDSSISILRKLQDDGRVQIALQVIPAVSSLHLLAARHAIPLHAIGGELLVTTARRLLAGAARGHDAVAVMLDSNAAFNTIDPEDFDIYWGAYLGTEHEIVASGPLREVGPALAETVAREKQRHGWILDIYLLRRGGAKPSIDPVEAGR